jgi:rare lipoprotein A
MQSFNFIKIAVGCIFLMFQSPADLGAQQIYPNTLTNANYLDSVNIKRYKKWIDTSRIQIELNRITGIASFYGKGFNGTLTSTGEVFSNKKLTAACNLFKLNTIVRVTNLRTGANIMVRINDRMHPKMLQKGRIIDLSQAASNKLITNGKGIVKVAIEAIGYSKSTPKS